MIAWRRRTDLLPTHHSQTNPGDGCPWFQQTEHGSVCRHFGSDAWLQSRNCTQVTVDQIFGSIKGLVVSLVLKSVQQCHLQTELSKPGLAPRKWSSRPRAKRSVASRNSLQHELLCVPESRLSPTRAWSDDRRGSRIAISRGCKWLCCLTFR